MARVDREIVEAPLKTKNSYRAVTISQQAIEVLKQQKAKTNDVYVFPSPNGGPISPGSVNNMLKRVPEEHASQRSDSMICVTPSQPSLSKTVSSMLGHFSVGFTLDTYARSTTSAKKKPPKPWGKSS